MDRYKVIESIEELYKNLDYNVTKLVKARLDKDTKAEGDALFSMEGLIVACQQELSFLHGYLKDTKEPKGLDDTHKKDYKKLYEDIINSDWYKKAYVGKSLGDMIPVEGLDEVAETLYPDPNIKRYTSVFANEMWSEVEKLREAFKAGAKWMMEQLHNV